MIHTLLTQYFPSLPPAQQLALNFDVSKKVFLFSATIFYSAGPLPRRVWDYVRARRGIVFQPHETIFEIASAQEVELVQRFPFAFTRQLTLRQQALSFWHMAQKCHQLLKELALEETFDQETLDPDDD